MLSPYEDLTVLHLKVELICFTFLGVKQTSPFEARIISKKIVYMKLHIFFNGSHITGIIRVLLFSGVFLCISSYFIGRSEP